LIKNLKELNKADKTKNVIIIAKVGRKNREKIIKQARENKIDILNIKIEKKK